MVEICKINEKISFWDKLFKEDIVRQANFVEIVGWLGFFTFSCLIVFLLPVQVDITVPVQSVQFSRITQSSSSIEADLDQMYFSKVRIDQEAHIDIRLNTGEKIELPGKVTSIDLQSGQATGKIYITLIAPQQKIANVGNFCKVNARIVIERKPLTNIFIGGNKIKDFII